MKKTKTKFTLVLGLCFLAWLFIFPYCSLASESSLLITEIMYDPEGTDTGHTDWIEIYNPSENTITINKEDLGLIDEKELELAKDGIHYLNCHKAKENLILKAGEFVILANNDQEFKADYPDISTKVIDATFSLLTDGDTIRISSDKCTTFFEEISYEDSWGGKNNERTIEKIDFGENNIKENWQESYVKGGTPGEESSRRPKPKEYSKDIFINEILPDSHEDDQENEFIELYNDSDTDIDLSGWVLEDSSKNSGYLFSEKSIVESEDFYVIYRKDFKFALNNSGDETVYLINPNGDIVSKVAYSGSKENVSYNFDGENWRWSRFLTPGEENKFNEPPDSKTKKDKKIYVGAYADFKAEAKDKNKDKLKFTWDFGDGHKSYKKETQHKYEKTGKYAVTLKIFDGSEEKVETFKIEVKKFPHDKVKIRSLCPNPEGSDSKGEWLSIKNYSDEEINLNGWSIATGSKKLYNHWIEDDFEISPNKERIITRSYANFTLNNEEGKVELRYPDGKTAHEIKYKKKDGKVEEDEVYKKTDGGWQWLKAQTNTDLMQTNADIMQTDTEEVEEEDFSEFIGGQSVDESSEKNREELLNLGTNIKLASFDYSGGGIVLGVSTEKDSPSVYKFTETKPAENRTFQLTKKISSDINLFLNRTINLFISFL